MNTKKILGGAVALSLTFAVGSASADDVQYYGVTFESAVSTTPGEMNDWAYALDAGVTTYANTTGESYGWFGGADDASTIIAANGGQALQVDTGSSVLTNKLASSVTSEINSDGVLLDAGAYFEGDIKLTACNVLGEGITDGADAPKFAFYSYCDSTATPCTTNLVIYHAYLDNGTLVRTNEVFGTLIDAEAYTKVRIVMRKIYDGGIWRNVFSVALNGGEPLTSDLAFSEGIWFLSTEDTSGAEAQGISSVCFSGSGEVDNLSMGVVQPAYAEAYTATYTGSENIIITNTYDGISYQWEDDSGEAYVSEGTVLSFYPTEGNVITNVLVDGVAQPYNPGFYEVEVICDTNVVVLAGAYTDPEGREIEDSALVGWLRENNFTQADINALGHDAAATDRLYECWLINCDFTVEGAGGALSFTDITVSNRVSMTVQFVRKAPLAGCINGTILIYGANDLAAGFSSSPIPDESVEYFTGDPTFNLVTGSNDTVTQTAVATLNSSVTAKFFKAEIGIGSHYEPEDDPWEEPIDDPVDDPVDE